MYICIWGLSSCSDNIQYVRAITVLLTLESPEYKNENKIKYNKSFYKKKKNAKK